VFYPKPHDHRVAYRGNRSAREQRAKDRRLYCRNKIDTIRPGATQYATQLDIDAGCPDRFHGIYIPGTIPSLRNIPADAWAALEIVVRLSTKDLLKPIIRRHCRKPLHHIRVLTCHIMLLGRIRFKIKQ
jgi:hypothetical protein